MLFGKELANKTRWRWLIGEVAVVIIGVLAALSIEQAWSDRQDRNLEIEYLKTIRSAVLGDIEYVDGFSQDQLKIKMDALEAIGPVVRGFEPIPENVEEFLRNTSLGAIGGISPTYRVTRSTFDDLVSTGNLRLISDADVRRGIVSYYASYDIQFTRVVERLTDYPAYVHGIIPAELRDDMHKEDLDSFNVDRAIEKVMNDEFQTLVNREYNLALFMKGTYVTYLRSANTFLNNLEAHIQRLD